jgi:acyl-CoA thioester hydrolase
LTERPSDGAWPDISGRLVRDADGLRHVLPVRVYFEDTDAGGVVYHASYVRFCERGRTDFLRRLGVDARGMIDGSDHGVPAAFVVRRMTLDFIRPSRMDALLEVETRVRELGGASVSLDQRIASDGRTIFEATVAVVLVSMAGKPLRLPDRVRQAFQTAAADDRG